MRGGRWAKIRQHAGPKFASRAIGWRHSRPRTPAWLNLPARAGEPGLAPGDTAAGDRRSDRPGHARPEPPSAGHPRSDVVVQGIAPLRPTPSGQLRPVCHQNQKSCRHHVGPFGTVGPDHHRCDPAVPQRRRSTHPNTASASWPLRLPRVHSARKLLIRAEPVPRVRTNQRGYINVGTLASASDNPTIASPPWGTDTGNQACSGVPAAALLHVSGRALYIGTTGTAARHKPLLLTAINNMGKSRCPSAPTERQRCWPLPPFRWHLVPTSSLIRHWGRPLVEEAFQASAAPVRPMELLRWGHRFRAVPTSSGQRKVHHMRAYRPLALAASWARWQLCWYPHQPPVPRIMA